MPRCRAFATMGVTIAVAGLFSASTPAAGQTPTGSAATVSSSLPMASANRAGEPPRTLPPGHPTTPSAMPPGHPDPNGGVIPAGPLPHDPGEADDDGDDSDLPPGHPGMPSGHPETAQGAGGGGAAPGVFEPPQDTETEDPNLPKGTIEIELRDAENAPLPGTDLTIGMIHQSVAKGESREHKAATTDARGIARIDGLETGSGVAYRLSVVRDGATFAAMPFQLSPARGEHVVLHVYAVSHNLQGALVVMQGILFVEVKDDRVQIEQALTVFNLGRVAWVPDNVIMKLPSEFTALSAQQSMSDQGVDSVDKVGGRLKGTFAPGRHEIQFRWQLPYSGESQVDFEVGLPPHVAAMRAMASGSQGVRLIVSGFPDAQARTNAQGGRVLVTEKQATRAETFDSIHVKLEGLPTPGSGRVIATSLAGTGVLLGLGLGLGWGTKPRRVGRDKGARSRLLAELLELEEAFAAKRIGPKTYERARRELVDAIALTLDDNDDRRPRTGPTV